MITLGMALGACSTTPQIGASTKCSEFLKASTEARNQAVSKIAVDRNEAKVLQFGLRGNIEMVCGEHLSATLGDVIDAVAGKAVTLP